MRPIISAASPGDKLPAAQLARTEAEALSAQLIFDGGHQSSDGGLLLLREAERQARGVPAACGGDAGSARSGPGAARDVRDGDGARVGDCVRL